MWADTLRLSRRYSTKSRMYCLSDPSWTSRPRVCAGAVIRAPGPRSASARSEIAPLAVGALGRAAARHLERRHDAEGDVARLVVLRFGVRHVVRERADGRRARQRRQRLAQDQRRGVAARQQPRGRRLDVALDAAHLPGEEQIRARARLPRLLQHGRAVDVGVAMHHPEAHELGLFETGDHPQHASPARPTSTASGTRRGSSGRRPGCPDAAARRRTPAGLCADRPGRPASSGQSAACRARDAPSPRWAGTPRRTSPCRSRAPSPIRRQRARRRTGRTRPS